MTSDSEEEYPFKYLPFGLGECEDLEFYEPDGFHPVHLGDIYDGRYKIIHKLGFGGFSTVWLALDTKTESELARWVALKIVMARESSTYESHFEKVANHEELKNSTYFSFPQRTFCFNGPNGRHLCLVFEVLGPDLSRLSKGIYSRLQPTLCRRAFSQAAEALALLHSHNLCHGGKYQPRFAQLYV